MVNSTPSTPPDAQIRKEVQNGKSVHQPMITRLGRMKMTEESAPAAEQTVWTMLFSRILEPGKRPRKAIEITAAGIEVAMVRPTFNPRYILAAVKRKVSDTPRATPRQVSYLPYGVMRALYCPTGDCLERACPQSGPRAIPRNALPGSRAESPGADRAAAPGGDPRCRC